MGKKRVFSILGLEEVPGRKLPILTYPDPALKREALPVERFDGELEALCQNMLYTMYHAQGVGLAAPQVGVGRRIFVLDVDYEREKILDSETGERKVRCSDLNPHIFINPVIVEKSGEMVFREGCLSLPGVYQEVTRFERIAVNYQDLNGNGKVWRGEGLFSVCIQHEKDHLDGIVFVERLSDLKRDFLLKKYFKKRSACQP